MLRPAVAEILPEVLPTFAFIRMSLFAPVAINVTVPVPLAMTELPRVSVPAAVREIAPLDPVLIAPVVLMLPVLPTTILPPPVWLIPVIVNAPVLVS